MLFNSLAFLIFLPVVLSLYFVLDPKLRRWFLLISSLFFYGYWSTFYLGVMILSVVPDFFIAKRIETSNTQKSKKQWLYLSVAINFGLLIYFKYLGMLAGWTEALASLWNPDFKIHLWNIVLPLGISFHRFQGQAYVIDVYRGDVKALKRFDDLLLFVFYFPQLVAGPIERAKHLLSELFTEHHLLINNIRIGIGWMLIGFFKKLVVADRLAPLVNSAYSNFSEVNIIAFLLGTYFFAFQIYADFSGYSDIAKGCSKLFGIDLMQNFDIPYSARNISEFWKRWHISLSTWFRDYVYIPLGGNRVTGPTWARNILLVFGLSGLWHGASITFLIWGILHAVYLIIERYSGSLKRRFMPTTPRLKKLDMILSQLLCFHAVLFAWIWFRIPDLESALAIFGRFTSLFDHKSFNLSSVFLVFAEDSSSIEKIISALVCVLFLLPFIHFVQRRLGQLRKWQLWYGLIIILICFLGVFRETSFIYFQF